MALSRIDLGRHELSPIIAPDESRRGTGSRRKKRDALPREIYDRAAKISFARVHKQLQ